MGIARSLLLAVTAAASVVIACVMPWQDTANLESPLPRSDVSMTPTGQVGSEAPAAPGQGIARARGPSDRDEMAPPPEVATLAPRTPLGSPQRSSPMPVDPVLLGRELQRELAR